MNKTRLALVCFAFLMCAVVATPLTIGASTESKTFTVPQLYQSTMIPYGLNNSYSAYTALIRPALYYPTDTGAFQARIYFLNSSTGGFVIMLFKGGLTSPNQVIIQEALNSTTVGSTLATVEVSNFYSTTISIAFSGSAYNFRVNDVSAYNTTVSTPYSLTYLGVQGLGDGMATLTGNVRVNIVGQYISGNSTAIVLSSLVGTIVTIAIIGALVGSMSAIKLKKR